MRLHYCAVEMSGAVAMAIDVELESFRKRLRLLPFGPQRLRKLDNGHRLGSPFCDAVVMEMRLQANYRSRPQARKEASSVCLSCAPLKAVLYP